jgi:hypothetical protein
MNMNFLKRNMPIFIIGGVTVLVFIALIIVSGNKEPEGLGMKEAPAEIENNKEDAYNYGNLPAEEEEEFEFAYEYPEMEEVVVLGNPSDLTLEEKAKVTSRMLDRDALKPVVVEFKEEGFSPKTVTILEGNVLILINRTDKTITLNQTIKRYDGFDNLEVAPGETYSVVTDKLGLWKVREMESYKMLTVSVNDL